jgi:hypothetical protein
MVTEEAQGGLTEYLASTCPAQFQSWNSLVIDAKEIFNARVRPFVASFSTEHNLSKQFENCVEWDVIGAVMETSYERFKPPVFFRRLLDVYDQGHFPCGWRGQWPSGTLIYI